MTAQLARKRCVMRSGLPRKLKAAGVLGWHPTDFLPRACGRDGAVGFGGDLERGLAQGPRMYP